MSRQAKIADAIRRLVAEMYNQLYGAYGSPEPYEGEYENLIQHIAKILDDKKLSSDEDD